VAPDARKSILILDEEDGFRRFLVAALTGVGYSLVDTSNSNQAITLLNGDVAFDLLIADVKMPSREPHGVGVGNIARLKRSQIKIIYVSSNPGHVPSGLIDIAETPLLVARQAITQKTPLSAVEAALVAPR
jgi:CheY-like chemotaxis protein